MKMQWFVIHTGSNSYHCYQTPLMENFTLPDFSGFTYKGSVFINGVTTDKWEMTSSHTGAMDYYDDSLTFEPVRFTLPTEQLDFFEFDAGSQDPNLFNVSISFPGIKCNGSLTDIENVEMSENMNLIHYLRAPLGEVSPLVLLAQDEYRVNHPKIDGNARSCAQSGNASWYACSGTAACGACNSGQYICAHKTLGCGCKTQITRTDDGKTVTVSVQDRGPYVAGRIVDVNQAPANALDMIQAGVVPVRISSSCNC